MEDLKKSFDLINNILIPSNARFISDSKIQVTFSSPFNSLNDSSTYISIFDTQTLNQSPIVIHNESEILIGYSTTGDIRAIIR